MSFDEAWPDSIQGELDDHGFRVIGTRALLANKRAAGRAKDLADVEALERLLAQNPRPTNTRK